MFKKVLMLIVVASFLSGCFNDREDIEGLKLEIQSVKNSLGQFQYIGIDPKIKLDLSNIKFIPSKKSYGTSVVKADVKVVQQNENFPVEHYSARIFFAVKDSYGREIDEVSHFFDIENKKCQTSISMNLYGTEKKEFSGCQLIPKFSTWNPGLEFKVEY